MPLNKFLKFPLNIFKHPLFNNNNRIKSTLKFLFISVIKKIILYKFIHIHNAYKTIMTKTGSHLGK